MLTSRLNTARPGHKPEIGSRRIDGVFNVQDLEAISRRISVALDISQSTMTEATNGTVGLVENV